MQTPLRGMSGAPTKKRSRRRRAVAQATEVSYALHTLGWKAFQDLCATITSEVWGQTVQSFLPSGDAGRDGAFTGEWQPAAGEVFRGTFTVQCKFTVRPGKTLRLTDISGEIEKARRLAARGLARNYILFTNAGLTARAEQAMRAAFEGIEGIERFAAYGGEWISRAIRESKRLRMLVPRIYGLGDLSQILDERAYRQAQDILSALGDDLAKFVITEAYRRSAKALVDHGFVLLLGEPASGKSTIAASLAVGATDVWGCSTIRVRDADDFVRHWNPDEPRQFFWVDDAFGATQFDWTAAASWNRCFSHMDAAIRKGARVVFTSRDYIYRSARQHLKQTAFPLLRESQVVIDVEKLSKEEKEQILYNHLRLGPQPVAFRRALKPFLPMVAGHHRFLPEIARRLGNPLFTKNIAPVESMLLDFIERPLELLQEIIRTLDDASRAALALVFMRGGSLASPIQLAKEEEHAVALMGGTPVSIRQALNSLDGSLVNQVSSEGRYWWRFKHPTVRDAFGALIAEDRELMDIYLVGTPRESLLSEITCGDLGLRGTRVMVPVDRYPVVARRIDEIDPQKWGAHDERNRFLARRADSTFLQYYLESHPNFFSTLPVWSYLTSITEAPVFARLHECGLLPEAERTRFVTEAGQLGVETPDAGFLHEDFRKLFTPEELHTALEMVRTRLLENLTDTVRNWRYQNFSRKSSPSEHFDPLKSELEDFKKEFNKDARTVALIDAGLGVIDEAIEEMSTDEGQTTEDDYEGPRSAHQPLSASDRSVFDDVDG